jgi:uncharacterized protein YfaQ (DUF2300 family)
MVIDSQERRLAMQRLTKEYLKWAKKMAWAFDISAVLLAQPRPA